MVNFLTSFILSPSFLITQHINSSVILANTLIATPTIPNFFIQARSVLAHSARPSDLDQPLNGTSNTLLHTLCKVPFYRCRTCGLH